MSRLARAVQIVADALLPASVAYGRAEPTEPALPTLDAMTDQRIAAESRLHRRTNR